MTKLLLILALVFPLAASAQWTLPQHIVHATSGGPAPTITYGSTACVNNASAASANCPMSGSVAVGDLLVVVSKTESATSGTTAAMSFADIVSCSSPTQVIPASTFQSNGSGHFSTAMFACIVTTAGAATPIVTWTGGDAGFTDIAVATYHTTNSWKTTFVDQTASSVAATVTTGCPTGTTATTTNANDLIVATCQNFNVGETWGTLSGFTNRGNSSRNTVGWYDKSVSATGTQSTTIPLSSTDVGIGMIAAFASN
jgi:hypothetical protein